MVPVLKPNGDVCICVDLRRLNNVVKREKFVLPTTEEVISKLSGARIFSSLYAASGFYQIPLEEKSRKLTAFITPFDRYAFKWLPFRIRSAPEIFQRKMTEILQGLDDVAICIVFSETEKEHDERLEKVLKVMETSGLKLNKKNAGSDKIKFASWATSSVHRGETGPGESR